MATVAETGQGSSQQPGVSSWVPRELDLKRGSWDWKQCPDRMLVQQAVALPSKPGCRLHMPAGVLATFRV